MAESKKTGLEGRVRVLEYQIGAQSKQLDRIEGKQDAAIRQIDTLKYVGQHEFDQFVFATNKRTNDLERLPSRVTLLERAVYSFIGLVLILVITAVVTGALKK